MSGMVFTDGYAHRQWWFAFHHIWVCLLVLAEFVTKMIRQVQRSSSELLGSLEKENINPS